MKTNLTKGTIIYWKHKNNLTYSKSGIQDIIKASEGELLELGDENVWTNYPTRVLTKDIDIITKTIED